MNLFVGVIVGGMSEAIQEAREETGKDAENNDELMASIRVMEKELARFKECLPCREHKQ